jgi:hypothetical protein
VIGEGLADFFGRHGAFAIGFGGGGVVGLISFFVLYCCVARAVQ